MTEIACFRFLIVSETSVESRHAKVALETRRHVVGPSRVSLANRYPMLQTWLATGFVNMTEFLSYFDAARSTRKVISRLGLERHPLLCQKGLRGSKLRTRLTSILYHCSLEDVYASQKLLAHEAQKAQAKEKKRRAPDRLERPRRATTYRDVEVVLLEGHIPRRLQEGLFYSCPEDVLQLTSLGACNTATSRGVSFAHAEEILPETFSENASEGAEASRLTFFQLLFRNPSAKKVLGRDTLANKVLVSMHESKQGPEQNVVLMQAQASESSPDPAFFLQGWRSLQEVKDNFLEYHPLRLVWFVAGLAIPRTLVGGAVELFTQCVEQGAFDGGLCDRGLSVDADDSASVDLLCSQGLLEHLPEGNRWRLTSEGMQGAQSWQVLGEGAQVCAVRDLPYEKMTKYELASSLSAAGWEWKPKLLARNRAGMRSPFKPGDPKVWYSDIQPLRQYMLVLLRSEERVAQAHAFTQRPPIAISCLTSLIPCSPPSQVHKRIQNGLSS